jgi:hypothetical protein
MEIIAEIVDECEMAMRLKPPGPPPAPPMGATPPRLFIPLAAEPRAAGVQTVDATWFPEQELVEAAAWGRAHHIPPQVTRERLAEMRREMRGSPAGASATEDAPGLEPEEPLVVQMDRLRGEIKTMVGRLWGFHRRRGSLTPEFFNALLKQVQHNTPIADCSLEQLHERLAVAQSWAELAHGALTTGAPVAREEWEEVAYRARRH